LEVLGRRQRQPGLRSTVSAVHALNVASVKERRKNSMIRRAVLVEAGDVPGQTKITGPEHDVRRMRVWLTSNVGGAWEDHEIETLSNPSPTQVRTAVERAAGADYTVSAFSGHGWIEENGMTGERTKK